MRRRTRYGFPSVLHEVHPFAWLFRRYHRMWHKGRPPMTGVVVEAPALHAVCLAATRETFARIGAFESGYRFGHEDVAYSWRAEKADIPRRILLDAHAFKIAPQLYGELPLAVRYGMERSLYRLVRATRGTVYAAGFVLIRRAKSLVKWMIASVLNLLIFRCSRLLDLEERFHRAVLFMPWHDGETLVIPPDIESHVRWEDFA